MSEETESIVIEIIKPNSKSFAIIIAYRPPQSNADDFFNDILNSIKMLDYETKEIYMLGDFNCDLLASRSHRATTMLNSISEIYQLEQLITEPTRCTINSNTLIDLIFTNSPNRVVASGVIHLGISDQSYFCSTQNCYFKQKYS